MVLNLRCRKTATDSIWTDNNWPLRRDGKRGQAGTGVDKINFNGVRLHGLQCILLTGDTAWSLPLHAFLSWDSISTQTCQVQNVPMYLAPGVLVDGGLKSSSFWEGLATQSPGSRAGGGGGDLLEKATFLHDLCKVC